MHCLYCAKVLFNNASTFLFFSYSSYFSFSILFYCMLFVTISRTCKMGDKNSIEMKCLKCLLCKIYIQHTIHVNVKFTRSQSDYILWWPNGNAWIDILYRINVLFVADKTITSGNEISFLFFLFIWTLSPF